MSFKRGPGGGKPQVRVPGNKVAGFSAPGRQTAFTLVELLLVVAIAGVLMGIALPSYQAYIERSNFTLAKADILEISRELDDFFLEFKRYPDSLDDVGCGGMEDPWGNPYRYLNIAATLVDGKGKGKNKPRKDKNLHPINSDYDLYSIGPDGKSVLPLTAQPSRDDIIRANDGAFIGLAADY